LFKGTELKLSRKTSLPTPPGDNETDSTAQLASLRGIARQEEYQGPDNGREKATDGEDGGEDRVLSAIFSKSGVHSAHEHEAIIAGSALKPKITADPEMITREAKRVAALAAQELQRAGEVARTIPVGVPTWTGTYGVAGRPEERHRALPIGRGAGRGRGAGGPSSSSILGNLAARQSADLAPATSRRDSPAPGQPRGKDFIILIRDYLKSHGGSVYTQMLIDHFNRYCGTEQRTAQFKEMLTKIAKLEKGRNGRGRWTLKDEFKD
jgi:DNA excision repair protein ERCC-6